MTLPKVLAFENDAAEALFFMHFLKQQQCLLSSLEPTAARSLSDVKMPDGVNSPLVRLSVDREGRPSTMAAAAGAGCAGRRSWAAGALCYGQRGAQEPRARVAGTGRAVQIRPCRRCQEHLPHDLVLPAGAPFPACIGHVM